MMKRKLLFLITGSLVVCVGLALGVLAILPPRPGVTKTNFDRIQNEMTRVQVEQRFAEKGEVIGETLLAWEAEDGSLASVTFQDDRVIAKRWTASNESFLDKIRRRLHLP